LGTFGLSRVKCTLSKVREITCWISWWPGSRRQVGFADRVSVGPASAGPATTAVAASAVANTAIITGVRVVRTIAPLRYEQARTALDVILGSSHITSMNPR